VHPSQEARLLAALDHERTWRELLQAQLTTVEAANRQAHEQLVQARLDGEREHQASTKTGKICTALQERLLELEANLRQHEQQRAGDAAALRQLEQQRAADAAAAADRLTKRHAEFTAGLAQAARSRDALAQQLNEARAALEEARQRRDAAAQQVESLRSAHQQAEARHASERMADAERRAALDAEVTANVAQISDERDALRLQLTAASAALEASQAQRARETAAARDTLEQTMEAAARAKREADVRHALEQATAASRQSALQRQFEESVAQAATAREAFERQLNDATAALARADEERAAEAERRAAHDAQVAVNVARISDEREALRLQLSAKTTDLEASEAQRAREAADARATLEQTVATAARARREAEERHAQEIATAGSHRDALQRQFDHALAQAAATRTDFERKLSDAAAALARAKEEAAEVAASLAQVSDERDGLQLQLTARTSELEASQAQRAREEANARLELASAVSHREAVQRQFDEAVAHATAARADFERQLSTAAAALERANEQRAADAERHAAHDAEVAANLAQISDERDGLRLQLTERTSELEASQAQRAREETNARAALEQTVETAARAMREAEECHALERATGASHRDALQKKLDDAVAQAASARADFERQLRDAAAALDRAQRERAAETERRDAHDAEVAASLAQISDERETLRAQLSATAIALDESREQRARESADAQATLEQTVAEAAAMRAGFERQLGDAAAALDRAREHRAADAVAAAQRLAAREAELGAMLADGATVRSVLEARLADAQLALERAEQHAEAERASAGARERSMQDQLSREAVARASVERELSETRAESARARRRVLAAASALRRRTSENRSRLESQLADERADYQRRLDAQAQEILHAGLECTALNEALDMVRGELQALRDTYDGARHDFEQAHTKSEADLQRLSDEYDQTRQSLNHLRDAFNTLERVSSEHALERARLEGVVADRDTELRAQASTHAAAELAAQDAVRRVEEALRQTAEAKDRQIAGLERDLDTLHHELERTNTDREKLRKEADQLRVLQTQLDASQQENWRQFEHAPSAMWRVTRDGAVVATNQALARILGYRATDNLATLDFPAAMFEAPGDLRWLIDRVVAGSPPEAVETVWKRKDRTRLTVRLQVVRANDNWIEVSAEDVTQLRATEEDLRHARRMEAVGRLASEVAVTCDTLLRGVSHGGQHWLAAMGSDLGLRHQGEQLLGEVAQATSLLQRLAAYGNEQIDALEPVNLQRVLRNLEPVLKRVAGDDIEVVLPRKIPALLVDVERSRVERVLVNVASYARERIPHGGRLKIDLTSAVVDRTFLDKYPNVRPGSHVIVTVTEERGTRVAAPPVLWPIRSSEDAMPSAGDKPGVDLSALVQLLADCGGHLWVSAEPPGNMTLKIHLPMHAADGTTSPVPPLTASHSGKSRGRWFRH
jgi:PAS domain S-box-containing protein